MNIENINVTNPVELVNGRRLKQPHFVCTHCALQFEGDTPRTATCPKCGDTYDHFHTRLIRCGTFALAYWCEANPGIEIKRYTPGN